MIENWSYIYYFIIFLVIDYVYFFGMFLQEEDVVYVFEIGIFFKLIRLKIYVKIERVGNLFCKIYVLVVLYQIFFC